MNGETLYGIYRSALGEQIEGIEESLPAWQEFHPSSREAWDRTAEAADHVSELKVVGTEVREDSIILEFNNGQKLDQTEAKALVADIQNALIAEGEKP
jgi:hypothetical protein